MKRSINSQRVVMAGTAILPSQGELHVEDQIGTSLTLRFNQPDSQSRTGGSLQALKGELPVNTPGGNHVYGFASGFEGKTHWVLVAVEEYAIYKVVTYTVTADFDDSAV